MYRQDIAEENGEIEPYSIDDVIDIVCEWNYELILDAEAHRSDPIHSLLSAKSGLSQILCKVQTAIKQEQF